MTLATLSDNWWMVAVRGGFSIVFGLSILLWPSVTLPAVIVLFAAYAMLDGLWALASVVRASEYALDAWPVAVEGVASLTLGAIALIWPFVSREIIYWIAAWGVITGALEIVGAFRLPREVPGHWLLMTGGGCSLFLAVLIVMLPLAGIDRGATVLGAYALVFGVLLSLTAFGFHRGHRGRARRPRRARAVTTG